MARIPTYENDTSPTRSDRLLGTDGDSNDATRNYTIGSILDLATNSDSALEGANYRFSSTPTAERGRFYNSASESDSFDDFVFHKTDLDNVDNTALFTEIRDSSNNLVLSVKNDNNNFSYYNITSVTIGSTTVTVRVTDFEELSTGDLVNDTGYTIGFVPSVLGRPLGTVFFENTNVVTFNNPSGNIYNRRDPNGGDFLFSDEGAVTDGLAVLYSVGSEVPNFVTSRAINHVGVYVADNSTVNRMEVFNTTEGYTIKYYTVEGFDPLSLNPLLYINANEGVTVVDGNVTAISDLSGNSNNFNIVGTLPFVERGINGQPSFRFDGTAHIISQNAVTRTDQSKVAAWAVFQITDGEAVGAFHSVFVLGFPNYNAGSSGALQVFSLNNTNSINVNYNNNALDDSFTKPQLEPHSVLAIKNTNDASFSVDGLPLSTSNGTLDVLNNPIIIGGHANINAKVLLCELGVIDNDTNTLSSQNITDLNAYFKQRYNINQKEQVTVFNQGLGGNNTQNVIDRLASIRADNPEVVVLMLGTNDWRHPLESQRIAPAQFKTNLLAIVDDLESNNIDVVLMSFPPLLNEANPNTGVPFYDYVCPIYGEPSGCEPNATAEPFLTAIDEVVSERSLEFIDIHQHFVDAGQPTALESSWVINLANGGVLDGVHLSDRGTTELANVVANRIFNLGETYNRISCVGDSITFGSGLAANLSYPTKLYNILN